MDSAPKRHRAGILARLERWAGWGFASTGKRRLVTAHATTDIYFFTRSRRTRRHFRPTRLAENHPRPSRLGHRVPFVALDRTLRKSRNPARQAVRMALICARVVPQPCVESSTAASHCETILRLPKLECAVLCEYDMLEELVANWIAAAESGLHPTWLTKALNTGRHYPAKWPNASVRMIGQRPR